ncbi:MAG: hypothetical protein D6737_08940 [Chloroflexi bacterium]|nr:MAG: hypothetical protein D6737_08940 [Chloroflexota bacterium]
MDDVELIFDHVGIPTDDKQPDEDWVESTRVWVTNPRNHKYRVEFLRFEPDTPCKWEVVNLPHVAYRVKAEDFPKLLEGVEILIEPFEVDENLTIAYVKKNGMPVEYMVFKDPDLWFGKRSEDDE